MDSLSNGDRRVTVGLLWHSVNSDNLGIGALTASHLVIIDAVACQLGAKVRFRVIGWRDPSDAYITRPDVSVVALRSRDVLRPRGLYAAVRQCDLVLDISAGDSFADIYGIRRFGLNLLSKAVVLLARRPLVLGPQTIGPFGRWWTKLLARLVLRRACKVVTRDRLSSQFLLPLRLGPKLTESTDVAFRLPYHPPPRRTGPPVRVGLNVSGLLFNGGYTRQNMFGLACDYPALVGAMLRYFTSLPDCQVHLIGHVNSERNVVEDDHRVAKQLGARYPGVVVAPRFGHPCDAKSHIATMDFFCGSRMHACIAAFSSGVPVVPIAYSRKFAGLFSSLGYTVISDCRTQTADEVMETVTGAFHRRAEIRKQVENGRAVADMKLHAYEAVLKDLLLEVAYRQP